MKINHGACIGAADWSDTVNAGVLESVNPATGDVIAKVYQCSKNDYEKVIIESQKAFKDWRMVPAPVRGQLVREMAEKLRNKKDAFGESPWKDICGYAILGIANDKK